MRLPRPRLNLRTLLILVAVAAVPIALIAPKFRNPLPKVAIEGSPTFACGKRPPNTFQRHTWMIGNEGRAPLILIVGETSRGCGLNLWEGENRAVAPGGKAEIQLTWPSPGGEALPFSAFATIGTNDPETPKIRLQVDGITSPRDGFAPLGDPAPGRVGR